MRFRVLLIIAMVAAVGGCGFEVRIAGQAEHGPLPTAKPVTPRNEQTATPDPAMPHRTIRFRLYVADADHTPVIIQNKPGPNPIRDAQAAKAAWQDPALATDKAAQQRVATTMDCEQVNPMLGQDDPNLPLATCGRAGHVVVLAPILLDASMIAGATYGDSPWPAKSYTAWVKFKPAGAKIITEMAPKNINVLLAMTFDGQVVASLGVTEKLTDTLGFQFPDITSAHDAATAIVSG